MLISLVGVNDIYIYNNEHTPDVLSNQEKWFHVFRGKSQNTNKAVVIKQIIGEGLIQNENHIAVVRDILTNLHSIHTSIVKTLDVIANEEGVFIVREYVEGISLHTVNIDPDYKYTRKFSFYRELILKLCDVVSVFHEQGVVHRNLKPTNIILTTNSIGHIDVLNPTFVIVDFERLLLRQTSLLNFPRTPMSIMYSPPEQVLRHEEIVGFWSDIYSVGHICYEVISRKYPYHTPVHNPNLIHNLQASFPLRKLPSIPKPIFTVIAKASYKYPFTRPPQMLDPEEVAVALKTAVVSRYHSMQECKQAFEAAFNEVTKKKNVVTIVKGLFGS